MRSRPQGQRSQYPYRMYNSARKHWTIPAKARRTFPPARGSRAAVLGSAPLDEVARLHGGLIRNPAHVPRPATGDKIRGGVEKGRCGSGVGSKCPVIAAAGQRDPETLRYLLKNGVDANHMHTYTRATRRICKRCPLLAAVRLNRPENIEILLEHGAHPNIVDGTGDTPLLLACRSGNAHVVRLLLSKGSDTQMFDRWGNTPAHVVARTGHLGCMKVLLEYSADTQQPNHDGLLPVHIAAQQGHVHILKALCQKDKSNVTACTDSPTLHSPTAGRPTHRAAHSQYHGGTGHQYPLHLAAEQADYETVTTLLDQFAADPNILDSAGNTALHRLVLRPYRAHLMRSMDCFNATAAALVKYGVPFEDRNNSGQTAMGLAASNGYPKIFQLLMSECVSSEEEDEDKWPEPPAVPSGPAVKDISCQTTTSLGSDGVDDSTEDGHTSAKRTKLSGSSKHVSFCEEIKSIIVEANEVFGDTNEIDTSNSDNFVSGFPKSDRPKLIPDAYTIGAAQARKNSDTQGDNTLSNPEDSTTSLLTTTQPDFKMEQFQNTYGAHKLQKKTRADYFSTHTLQADANLLMNRTVIPPTSPVSVTQSVDNKIVADIPYFDDAAAAPDAVGIRVASNIIVASNLTPLGYSASRQNDANSASTQAKMKTIIANSKSSIPTSCRMDEDDFDDDDDDDDDEEDEEEQGDNNNEGDSKNQKQGENSSSSEEEEEHGSEDDWTDVDDDEDIGIIQPKTSLATAPTTQPTTTTTPAVAQPIMTTTKPAITQTKTITTTVLTQATTITTNAVTSLNASTTPAVTRSNTSATSAVKPQKSTAATDVTSSSVPRWSAAQSADQSTSSVSKRETADGQIEQRIISTASEVPPNLEASDDVDGRRVTPVFVSLDLTRSPGSLERASADLYRAIATQKGDALYEGSDSSESGEEDDDEEDDDGYEEHPSPRSVPGAPKFVGGSTKITVGSASNVANIPKSTDNAARPKDVPLANTRVDAIVMNLDGDASPRTMEQTKSSLASVIQAQLKETLEEFETTSEEDEEDDDDNVGNDGKKIEKENIQPKLQVAEEHKIVPEITPIMKSVAVDKTVPTDDSHKKRKQPEESGKIIMPVILPKQKNPGESQKEVNRLLKDAQEKSNKILKPAPPVKTKTTVVQPVGAVVVQPLISAGANEHDSLAKNLLQQGMIKIDEHSAKHLHKRKGGKNETENNVKTYENPKMDVDVNIEPTGDYKVDSQEKFKKLIKYFESDVALSPVRSNEVEEPTGSPVPRKRVPIIPSDYGRLSHESSFEKDEATPRKTSKTAAEKIAPPVVVAKVTKTKLLAELEHEPALKKKTEETGDGRRKKKKSDVESFQTIPDSSQNAVASRSRPKEREPDARNSKVSTEDPGAKKKSKAVQKAPPRSPSVSSMEEFMSELKHKIRRFSDSSNTSYDKSDQLFNNVNKSLGESFELSFGPDPDFPPPPPPLSTHPLIAKSTVTSIRSKPAMKMEFTPVDDPKSAGDRKSARDRDSEEYADEPRVRRSSDRASKVADVSNSINSTSISIKSPNLLKLDTSRVAPKSPTASYAENSAGLPKALIADDSVAVKVLKSTKVSTSDAPLSPKSPKSPVADGNTKSSKSPLADGNPKSPKSPLADGNTKSPKSPLADGSTKSLKSPLADVNTKPSKSPVADGNTKSKSKSGRALKEEDSGMMETPKSPDADSKTKPKGKSGRPLKEQDTEVMELEPESPNKELESYEAEPGAGRKTLRSRAGKEVAKLLKAVEVMQPPGSAEEKKAAEEKVNLLSPTKDEKGIYSKKVTTDRPAKEKVSNTFSSFEFDSANVSDDEGPVDASSSSLKAFVHEKLEKEKSAGKSKITSQNARLSTADLEAEPRSRTAAGRQAKKGGVTRIKSQSEKESSVDSDSGLAGGEDNVTEESVRTSNIRMGITSLTKIRKKLDGTRSEDSSFADDGELADNKAHKEVGGTLSNNTYSGTESEKNKKKKERSSTTSDDTPRSSKNMDDENNGKDWDESNEEREKNMPESRAKLRDSSAGRNAKSSSKDVKKSSPLKNYRSEEPDDQYFAVDMPGKLPASGKPKTGSVSSGRKSELKPEGGSTTDDTAAKLEASKTRKSSPAKVAISAVISNGNKVDQDSDESSDDDNDDDDVKYKEEDDDDDDDDDHQEKPQKKEDAVVEDKFKVDPIVYEKPLDAVVKKKRPDRPQLPSNRQSVASDITSPVPDNVNNVKAQKLMPLLAAHKTTDSGSDDILSKPRTGRTNEASQLPSSISKEKKQITSNHVKETDIDEYNNSDENDDDGEEDEDHYNTQRENNSGRNLTALARRFIKHDDDYDEEEEGVNEEDDDDDEGEEEHPLDRSRPLCTIKEMPRETDEMSVSSQAQDSKRNSRMLEECEWEELDTLIQQPVKLHPNSSFDLDMLLTEDDSPSHTANTETNGFEKVKGRGKAIGRKNSGKDKLGSDINEDSVKKRSPRQDRVVLESEISNIEEEIIDPMEETRLVSSFGSKKRPERPKLPERSSTASIDEAEEQNDEQQKPIRKISTKRSNDDGKQTKKLLKKISVKKLEDIEDEEVEIMKSSKTDKKKTAKAQQNGDDQEEAGRKKPARKTSLKRSESEDADEDESSEKPIKNGVRAAAAARRKAARNSSQKSKTSEISSTGEDDTVKAESEQDAANNNVKQNGVVVRPGRQRRRRSRSSRTSKDSSTTARSSTSVTETNLEERISGYSPIRSPDVQSFPRSSGLVEETNLDESVGDESEGGTRVERPRSGRRGFRRRGSRSRSRSAGDDLDESIRRKPAPSGETKNADNSISIRPYIYSGGSEEGITDDDVLITSDMERTSDFSPFANRGIGRISTNGNAERDEGFDPLKPTPPKERPVNDHNRSSEDILRMDRGPARQLTEEEQLALDQQAWERAVALNMGRQECETVILRQLVRTGRYNLHSSSGPRRSRSHGNYMRRSHGSRRSGVVPSQKETLTPLAVAPVNRSLQSAALDTITSNLLATSGGQLRAKNFEKLPSPEKPKVVYTRGVYRPPDMTFNRGVNMSFDEGRGRSRSGNVSFDEGRSSMTLISRGSRSSHNRSMPDAWSGLDMDPPRETSSVGGRRAHGVPGMSRSRYGSDIRA